MKTRAELKRELDATVPQGEEHAYLESATAALEKARGDLQSLREERVRLMRQISVRERKRQDWKGKIPRGQGAPTLEQAAAEVERAGASQCHRICDINVIADKQIQQLKFRDGFRRALSGLEGFAKLWIIAVGPAGVQGDVGACSSVVETGTDKILYLWLADVLTVNCAAGLVDVTALNFLEERSDITEFAVLDVKPYLPYCEAWPENQP